MTKSVHRNLKSLEEAVESFVADMRSRLRSKERSSFSDIVGPLHKLEAALEDHLGNSPEVPRKEYTQTINDDGPGKRDVEIEESHESYGLVSINRVQGGNNLFGSSVRHPHFFVIRVCRGRRVMTTFGERFRTDHRVPILEIALSPAQFVEMITSQNIGDGVPCTIRSVEGVCMDPVPDGAGNEIKLTVDMFKSRLEDVMVGLKEGQASLNDILEKKVINKSDRDSIRSIIYEVNRLMTDSAPYAMKLMGEHTEKLIAKGKMEIDAFIQSAISRAGIRAIKDNNGTLLMGSGDDEHDR